MDEADPMSVILFPGSPAETMETKTFGEVCVQALEEQLPIVLTDNVILSETIRLKGQQELVIKGYKDTDRNGTKDDTTTSRNDDECCYSIAGDLHSLFLLNSKSRLVLDHVNLYHTLQTDNHKDVGAAVNLRSKGSLTVSTATIDSTSGFCVWAVQKCQVRLDQCKLVARERSAMVCFGQAQCTLINCQMDQAGVHAVCARGACRIQMHGCHITASAARAIYAYASACLVLERCHISGTIHPEKAAIEVSSLGCPESSKENGSNQMPSSSLTIKDCHVIDNAGVGIRLLGRVSYNAKGSNFVERNLRGNLEVKEHLEEEHLEGPREASTELRRDAAGSSFRRGDWWCRQCQNISIGRNESCSHCGVARSVHGRQLTMEEISQCNRGIDVRNNFPCDGNKDATKWYFDGDDEKGWLLYDEESNHRLEERYQRLQRGGSTLEEEESCIYLSGGKYQVNIDIMEQVNCQTQFLRSVRRFSDT